MNFFARLAIKFRETASARGYSCDLCGKELFDYPKSRLCSPCESGMEKNAGRVCPKCGRKTVAEGVCLLCKSHLPHFSRGVSAFVYGGGAAIAINRFKDGERYLAAYLGEQTAAAWKKSGILLPKEAWVVPVPLTNTRQRERGYNQSAELARVIARELGARTAEDVLIKQKENRPQKELPAALRRENVAGAYHVADRSACKGRTVLLIDDVMTTASTGDECARSLLNAGATEVFFLCASSVPEKQ